HNGPHDRSQVELASAYDIRQFPDGVRILIWVNEFLPEVFRQILRRARMFERRLQEFLLGRHAGLVRSPDENVKCSTGVQFRIVEAEPIISYRVLIGHSVIAGMNQGGMGDVEVSIDWIPVEIRRSQRS